MKRLLLLCCLSIGFAQPALGTTGYTVRKVEVAGHTVIDPDLLIALAGLQEGAKIDPSSGQIRTAIRKITKHDGIQSVAIYLSDIDEANALATFVIHVTEHPWLANYLIEGLTNKEKKSLLEKVTIQNNVALSPLFLHKTTASIKKFFLDNGFRAIQLSTELIPNQKMDGKVTLKIKVNKGEKNMVHKIIFEGNDHLDASLLRYHIKELQPGPHFTLFQDIIKKSISLSPIRKGGMLLQLPPTIDAVKRYFLSHIALFPSIFTEEKYLKAKENLILFYQSKGFRDVRIAAERLQYATAGKLNIYLKIEEGKQYTIRNIKWVGNYLHSDQALNRVLNLEKGKIYNPIYIKSRLNPGITDQTISDLYTNNGYLFFRAEMVETSIEDHQVDLEIRIQEGKRATIHQVNIVGNTLTHDYVIRRELLTLPGEKYSRGLVLESLRNLAMLRFFKPEKLIPEIEPDEAKGSVDLTYSVEEQPQFDLKLNANYSKGMVIGFELGSNNVSLQNLFTGKIPLGAGQQLHLTGGLQGKNHNHFSLSFQEPWFWLGESCYMFSLSINSSYQKTNHTKQNALDDWVDLMLFPLGKQNRKGQIRSIGGRVALGKKLARYWESHLGIDYHHYAYQQHTLLEDRQKRSGPLHELTLDLSLVYNSKNDPNYPTSGWSWSNFLTLTPPYTCWGYVASGPSAIPRFKEFGKFIMDASFFLGLPGNFVMNLRGHAGFLHSLSKKEEGPFERFYLGGTSHTTGGLLGADFIPLRGYPDDSLTPQDYKRKIKGGVLFHKFVSELRYPVMLAPICLYLLGFIEMGDSWLHYTHYNLLHMKKSIGGGIRIILPIPIIPMIGLDVGYRLDPIKEMTRSKDSFECHFTFGPSMR